MIFPTDTLQQKIEITDFKPFLAAENTSVQIILATTVVICITEFHAVQCVYLNGIDLCL